MGTATVGCPRARLSHRRARPLETATCSWTRRCGPVRRSTSSASRLATTSCTSPSPGDRELLDKLGVRWIVSTDNGRARKGEVARFGRIVVREHPGSPRGLAWLEGGGTIELLEADLRGGLVRVRVRDVDEGARVVFGIAGYPRWHLTLDGEPLEWFEDPVHGDAEPVSLAARKAGKLRGGKAGGDDGTEPTLIAAELPPGTNDAVLELRYDERGGVEWIRRGDLAAHHHHHIPQSRVLAWKCRVRASRATCDSHAAPLGGLRVGPGRARPGLWTLAAHARARGLAAARLGRSRTHRHRAANRARPGEGRDADPSVGAHAPPARQTSRDRGRPRAAARAPHRLGRHRRTIKFSRAAAGIVTRSPSTCAGRAAPIPSGG